MVTASRTIQEEDDERRDAAARWYRIEELVEQHPLHRAACAAGRRADEALAMEIVEQALVGVAAGPQTTPQVLAAIVKRYRTGWQPSFIDPENPHWFRLGGSPKDDRVEPMTEDEHRVVAAPTSQETVRICCGQPHTGAECPDGLVMCALCFDRVPEDRLHLLPNGAREDVCETCAHTERRAASTGNPTEDDQ